MEAPQQRRGTVLRPSSSNLSGLSGYRATPFGSGQLIHATFDDTDLADIVEEYLCRQGQSPQSSTRNGQTTLTWMSYSKS